MQSAAWQRPMSSIGRGRHLYLPKIIFIATATCMKRFQGQCVHRRTKRQSLSVSALPSAPSRRAARGRQTLAVRSADRQTAEMGHVWTAPSWCKSFFHVRSVQQCVRPFSAVHVTAGHNALPGTGPGQKDAFKDAVAHVGCPDRRIDRLCITCCSPFPTFTSRRRSARSHLGRERGRFSVAFTLGHHRRKPSAPACWPMR